MKTKKFISALMAVAMVASTMTTFSAFAVDDPDESGNGILDAIPVSFNRVVSEELSKTDSYGSYDNDWYSFSLDTASKLNIQVDASLPFIAGTSNPYYEIIDGDNDNTTVFKLEKIESTNSNVVYLSAGNYYIHFCSNDRNKTGTYDFKIVNTPTEESFDSKSNNNIGKASSAEFDTEYAEQISLNDDADYYTFNVAEEGCVTFNFDGDLENVDWKLYDSEEEVVQKGTLSKAGTDDAISAMKSYVMTAGTFTLGITKHDTSCGNYTLDLF